MTGACEQAAVPRPAQSEALGLAREQRFWAACVHLRFFALASLRAMVAAAMRTRFDQFGKQMVREALEGRCSVEPDAEVPAETRRIDLWVTPPEAGARAADSAKVAIGRADRPCAANQR